jgi:MFS family permease
MGVIGVLGPLGAVSGPVFGSLIVSHLHWSWLFFVNVPVSVVAFTLVAMTLNAPGRLRLPRPQWLTGLSRSLGFTFGPAIGAAVINASQSVSTSLTVPLVTALAAVAVSLAAAAQIRRLGADEPAQTNQQPETALTKTTENGEMPAQDR